MKTRRYIHFLAKPEASYYLILTAVGLLTGLGLIMVLSASAVQSFQQSGSSYSIFLKQLLFVAVGIGIAIVGVRLPVAKWEKLTKLALPLGAVALCLPLVPHLGKTINGNRNWIGVGSFTIQPSEFAKLALVFWIAMQLQRHQRKLDAGYESNAFISLLGGTLIFLGLVLVGRDLGDASILGGVMAMMLFISGIRLSHIAGVVGLMGGGVAALVIAQPYRLRRFAAIGNPFAPAVYKFAGWQPAHSLMGLASGGLFGVGIGASRQKWANLSEAHTDFIFAVIGEEMGLLGTLLVVSTFAVLLFAIFRTALDTRNLLSKFAVTGIGCWILIQVIFNLSSVIGIFPVVGVTLPFISYGGSSIVAMFIGISYVINVSRQNIAFRVQSNQEATV
jgi:cell division protein FtsW